MITPAQIRTVHASVQVNEQQQTVVIELCSSEAFYQQGTAGFSRGTCPEYITFNGERYRHHKYQTTVPTGTGSECVGRCWSSKFALLS